MLRKFPPRHQVATLDIELSTDGGGAWTDIVLGTDGQAGFYEWMVTAGASEICMVKISAGGALTDTSAKKFWIINPDGHTDGDGFTDKEEVDGGSNPFDVKDFPAVGWFDSGGCVAAGTSHSAPAAYLFLVLAVWLAAVRRRAARVE